MLKILLAPPHYSKNSNKHKVSFLPNFSAVRCYFFPFVGVRAFFVAMSRINSVSEISDCFYII